MTQAFGGFELVGKLGEGGMAEAFAALRRGPGGFEQRLCVKRILPAWRDDARFVGMFLEEARIAARLRHATIVQVVEAGEAEGTPYLALELVEGADLRRLLDGARRRGRPLGPEQVALVALDLVTALEIAHRAGILHRDVSPANVLVSHAGEVKLTDFGIAKAGDSSRHTATGIPKGKASYMAPEYATSGVASPRSDLYALGVTLYETATGACPFRAHSELASILRARRGGWDPVRALAPDVPEPLAAAIDRLVQPDPEARFPSAEALFDALGTLALPPGARRRLGQAVAELAEPAAVVEPTAPCAAPCEEPTRPSRPPR